MAKLYAGTWLESSTVERLDRIAQEMRGTRSQALRYVLEATLAGDQLAHTGEPG